MIKVRDLISIAQLIEMINWLIDNTFVTIGTSLFKQVIGIPMGTDCAPYLANLFLFAYEFEFLNDTLKQKDFSTLYKFNKCHRYIDDLLAVNNDGILNDFKGRIYPPELQLTCEDKSNQEVNYSDLHWKLTILLLNTVCLTNVIILVLKLSIFPIFLATFRPIKVMVSLSVNSFVMHGVVKNLWISN